MIYLSVAFSLTSLIIPRYWQRQGKYFIFIFPFSGCDTKADVTFLLDSSNNVGPQNFVKELNFIKDVSNNMQVAPDKVQVSALTFGTGVNNQFYLNQYTDNMALQQAITSIPYKGGMAKIPNAIRFATGTSFSPIHGGRGDAPHVAVLLTNQPSGTIDQVKLEAQTARDNGLIMYTVGIGSGVDQSELQEIASQPDGRHMFQAQNFDTLDSLSDLLATKICNGTLRLYKTDNSYVRFSSVVKHVYNLFL